MLFNSYQFIFIFLPVTVIAFFIAAQFNYCLAVACLGIASLGFYSSWHYSDLYILLPSIACNYLVGYWLAKITSRSKKILLIVSIASNLTILGYFKYANFSIDSWNDGVVGYITPIFNAAKEGFVPSFADSWLGALAYTVQLYFDFSGYSDMAIGLSLLFNIKLPINFNSPYQSVNITEFWRRWHITLSNFLRDYLYIPLGGNRHGQFRRYLNLLITMLIGGLWHGAGWTFILWGGLHGIYLIIHHSWRSIKLYYYLSCCKTIRSGTIGRSDLLCH